MFRGAPLYQATYTDLADMHPLFLIILLKKEHSMKFKSHEDATVDYLLVQISCT